MNKIRNQARIEATRKIIVKNNNLMPQPQIHVKYQGHTILNQNSIILFALYGLCLTFFVLKN